MYICLSDVLTAEQLSQLTDLLDRQALIDGRKTAGVAGRAIKTNLQLPTDAAHYPAMNELVTDAVLGNPQFSLAAMPKAMRPIRFARYSKGMQYGKHVDNAVMGRNPQLRIDLAFTLFLSSPESYEGGELLVHELGARRSFKLPAGALVVYPANSLHQVTEVTSGCRDVAVGWLQSMVRDPGHRQIIFELENLRSTMLAQSGRSAEFETLSRNIGQLWHMWVEV